MGTWFTLFGEPSQSSTTSCGWKAWGFQQDGGKDRVTLEVPSAKEVDTLRYYILPCAVMQDRLDKVGILGTNVRVVKRLPN